MYKQFTNEQHILVKSLYTGANNGVQTRTYLDYKDNQFAYKSALVVNKIIALTLELIINVIDQKNRFPNEVTIMDIRMAPDGRIMIYNNGPGIEPKLVESKDGTMIYAPELVMLHWLSGENLIKEEKSISAGTNGMGAKLYAYHSTKFEFSSGYLKGDLTKYTQLYETNHEYVYDTNGGIKDVKFISKTHAPNITTHKTVAPHNLTRTFFDESFEGFAIRATLDFKCINFGTYKQDEIMTNTIEVLRGIAALYNIWCRGTLQIYFNGEHIKFPQYTLPALASMMYKDVVYATSLKYLAYKSEPHHYWDIALIVHENYSLDRPMFSLVNGLVVNKGEHLSIVRDRVILIMQNLLDKTISNMPGYKKDIYRGFISIYMRCEIRAPTFSDQIKNSLQIDPSFVKELFKLTDSDLVDFTRKLYDVVLAYCSSHIPKKSSDKVNHASYIPATKLGINSRLIIIEGDSAAAFINCAIKGSRATTGGYANLGVFPLIGVVNNVRKTDYRALVEKTLPDGSKLTTVLQQPTRGKISAATIQRALNEMQLTVGAPKPVKKVTKLSITKKLAASQKKKTDSVLTKLATAIGLVHGVAYTKADLCNLKYGSVIIATDRDLDGVGNILGLVINWFQFYWPSLINLGYIQVLLVPLIRAIPSSKDLPIIEFGSQITFNNWYTKDPTSSKYEITYSKGLGSDDESIAVHIFEHLKYYLFKYHPTVDMETLYDIYYGRDPNKRKIELRKIVEPLSVTDEETMKKEHILYATWHMNIDVKSYQKYNLQRKLAGIDGLLIARRKLVALMKVIPHKKYKVGALCGELMSKMDYLHGEMSGQGVIKYAGQTFPGARTLPLIIAYSQFGSRTGTINGIGKDSGAARYLQCAPNSHILNTLFPKTDDDILPYMWDGDKRIEPVTYMPSLPYGIMETEEIPGHGWKQSRWARNVNGIINATNNLISKTRISMAGITEQTLKNIKWRDLNNPEILCMDTSYFGKCDVKIYNKRMVILGRYTVKEGTATAVITINEIPPRVGIMAYINSLRHKFESDQMKQIIGGATVSVVQGDCKISDVDIIVTIPIMAYRALIKHYETATLTVINPIDTDDDDDDDEDYESDSDESVAPVEEVIEKDESEMLYELSSIKQKHDGYRTNSIPAIIKALDLYMYVNTNLNFIVPTGRGTVDQTTPDSPDPQFTVKEYKSYWHYFIDWFNLRLYYYYLRCDRKRAIYAARILYYKNIIRYISSVVVEGKQIKFANKVATEAYLIAEKYDRIDMSITRTAPYMRGDEIMAKISCGKYDYIHDIKHHELNMEHLNSLKAQQATAESAYNNINTNFYATMFDEWLNDIRAFKVAYDEGIRTKWQYEHYSKVTAGLKNMKYN